MSRSGVNVFPGGLVGPRLTGSLAAWSVQGESVPWRPAAARGRSRANMFPGGPTICPFMFLYKYRRCAEQCFSEGPKPNIYIYIYIHGQSLVGSPPTQPYLIPY
jgi:hypothetical protein